VTYCSNFGDGSATQVLFDYVTSTIIYATPTQIAATVPRAVGNRATTQVIVQNGDVMSAPVTLPVAPFSARAVHRRFDRQGSGLGAQSGLRGQRHIESCGARVGYPALRYRRWIAHQGRVADRHADGIGDG